MKQSKVELKLVVEEGESRVLSGPVPGFDLVREVFPSEVAVLLRSETKWR